MNAGMDDHGRTSALLFVDDTKEFSHKMTNEMLRMAL